MSLGKDFFFLLNRKLRDKLFLCKYKSLVTSHLVHWFTFLIWNLCYIYRLKIYFPNLLLPIPAIFEDIRDLKIVDAAAFKNAVTSEGAWVMTATFARDIQALRFALCKRSPKHIITNRFGQRITDIRRFYFYDVVQEDQRAFSRIIFGWHHFWRRIRAPLWLQVFKELRITVWAEFRVNKRDLRHLAEC